MVTWTSSANSLQAILTFTNASIEDGGFHVVPGYHREMESVAAEILAMPGVDREMLTRDSIFNLPSVIMDELRCAHEHVSLHNPITGMYSLNACIGRSPPFLYTWI